MFKVNNKDTRTTSLALFGVFTANFEHISHLVLVFAIFNFEHVIVGYATNSHNMLWNLFPFSIVITFTTAESKLDYYQQKLNVRVDFWISKQLVS